MSNVIVRCWWRNDSREILLIHSVTWADVLSRSLLTWCQDPFSSNGTLRMQLSLSPVYGWGNSCFARQIPSIGDFTAWCIFDFSLFPTHPLAKVEMVERSNISNLWSCWWVQQQPGQAIATTMHTLCVCVCVCVCVCMCVYTACAGKILHQLI